MSESEFEGSFVTLLLKLFPLMKVESPSGCQIILNLEELILWNDVFAKITTGEDAFKEIAAVSISNSVFDELNEKTPGTKKKGWTKTNT